MVSAGDTPDVVEMPDRWLALYANNGMLENLEPYLATVGPHQGADRPHAADGALCRQHRLRAPLRLLPARHVLQQEAVQAGGHRRRRRRPWTSSPPTPRRSPRSPGKYGYCLRGGPGGAQRLGHVRRRHERRQQLLPEGRHLDLRRSGLGQGRRRGWSTSTRTATRRRTASTGASTRSSPASTPAPAPCSTRTRTR